MLKLVAFATALTGIGYFNRMADWAADYGYLAIIAVVAGDGVLPLFPGETVIITGGNIAANGELSLTIVILAGMIGAMIGDSAAYWLGRAGGTRIRNFLSRGAGRARVAAAERMVQRRGPMLVVVGRFLPGIRLAINLSCGAGQMDYKRFFAFNALGALLWSAQAAALGYLFGKSFEDQPWVGLLVALGVAGVVGGIVAIRERRHIARHNDQSARGG